MTISRGAGIGALYRNNSYGHGRSVWFVRQRFQYNRNYEQRPGWPLRFDGTSNLFASSSLSQIAVSSGAGAVTFPATGNDTIRLFLTASGTGTEVFSSTATGFFRLLSGSAAGTETFTATGADVLSNPQTSTFAGVELFPATGNTVLPAISGSAAGDSIIPAVTASGSTNVPVFYSAGSGTQTFSGNGGISQPGIFATSSGTEALLASGATTVPQVQETAAGTVSVVATGNTLVPKFGDSGAEVEAFVITGNTVMPRMMSIGAGTQGIVGAGTPPISSPNYASTSTATETFAVSGSTNLPAIRTFFGLAGVIAINGSGSGGGTTIVSGVEYVRVPTGGGSKSRQPREPYFTVKAKIFERETEELESEPSYKVSANLVSVNESQKLNEFRREMSLIDEGEDIEVPFVRSASRFIFKKVS